jgi:hypothetical protein
LSFPALGRHRLTPTRSYRILVVLEPSRATHDGNFFRNAEWALEDVPNAEAEELLADENIKGYIFRDIKHPAEDENHTAIISHEKVRN